MPAPFTFRGLLTIQGSAVPLEQAANMLAAAAAAEGARDIEQVSDGLTFRGVFKRRISPLQNISRAKLQLHRKLDATDISYAIKVDLFQIGVPVAALVLGLSFLALGDGNSHKEGGWVFTCFGAGTLVLPVTWAFVIRFWFVRWLSKEATWILR